jgi:hypothetical protein
MVNIYRTRRYYPFRCKYWKRDIKGVNDSNVLIHERKPDGIFYAKILSDKSKDHQELAGVIHFDYDELSIQTQDTVNIGIEDIVLLNNNEWFVTRVGERYFQRNAEFTRKPYKLTDITLRKIEKNGR